MADIRPEQGNREREMQGVEISILLIALGFLGACVTVPPPSLTADNPASPSAPEGGAQPPHNILAADDLTKKTRELLAQAGKSQDQPSSTPIPEEQQMGQTPGTKMR